MLISIYLKICVIIVSQVSCFQLNRRFRHIPEILRMKNDRYNILNEVQKRSYTINDKPDSFFNLAVSSFKKEFGELLNSLNIFQSNEKSYPESLSFTLSNEAIQTTEREREAKYGRVETSFIVRLLYEKGCIFLDSYFDQRPIPKFWLLETIARVPYFSFCSVLHLYETFGWLRLPSLRKVHNAEEWNELHHLLIMESLAGDKVSIHADNFTLALEFLLVYVVIIGLAR